jgi:hypothetical protein
MQHKLIYIVVIVLLAGGIMASLVGYYSVSIELSKTKAEIAMQDNNKRTLEFLSMFIKKVIKADKEIGFEERLELENAVRKLDDVAILAQWKKFTDSKTEIEAQSNTKDLLDLLVNKISANK